MLLQSKMAVYTLSQYICCRCNKNNDFLSSFFAVIIMSVKLFYLCVNFREEISYIFSLIYYGSKFNIVDS